LSKRTPHLVTKGGRHYYFRRRVPKELISHLGKAEISHALGDVTPAQAKVAVEQLGSQWQAHLLAERHRLGLAANPPAPAPIAELPRREPNPAEVHALAKQAGHTMLSEGL